MRLALLAVGRLRPALRSACDDYLGRLAHHARVEEIEVREAGRAPTADAARAEEASRLQARVPDGATLVCLARQGAPWSSEALAAQVDAWRVAARPVAVLIGGSHGLADDLLASAAHRWSLGAATLPHELARVVVAEQLYRAFTILRGDPYHKGRGG